MIMKMIMKMRMRMRMTQKCHEQQLSAIFLICISTILLPGLLVLFLLIVQECNKL